MLIEQVQKTSKQPTTISINLKKQLHLKTKTDFWLISRTYLISDNLQDQ